MSPHQEAAAVNVRLAYAVVEVERVAQKVLTT